MDIKKLLGKNVKQLREKHSLTQEQFAELLGVQPKTVTSIETGKRFVSCKTLMALANVFSVSYSELFSFDIEKALKPKRILEAKMSHLSDNECEYLLDIIKVHRKHSK